MFKKTKKRKKKKINIIPKLLLLSFIIIASTQTISVLFLANSPEFVLAENKSIGDYELQTPIGNTSKIEFKDNTTRPIADYINIIYKYAIGVVGIVAAVVLMIGGVVWLTAGGNAGQVSEAKAWIGSSLTGMILVLTSYMILYQINPDLVNIKATKITPIGEKKVVALNDKMAQTIGNCSWQQEKTNEYPEKYKNSNCDKNKKNKQEAKNNPENYGCWCKKLSSTKSNGVTCPDKFWPAHCAKCVDCNKIKKVPIKNGVGKILNTHLLKQLETAYLNAESNDVPFEITEAWPPGYNHKSIGHTNGKCVDISFKDRGNYKSPQKIKILYKLLNKQNNFIKVYALYECNSGPNCCYGFKDINCMYNPKASGPHFHIENKGKK